MFASHRNPISLDEPFSAIEPKASPMTESVNLGNVTGPETPATDANYTCTRDELLLTNEGSFPLEEHFAETYHVHRSVSKQTK